MVESKDKMGCRTGASVLVVLPGVVLTRPEMVVQGVDGLDGSSGLWMRLRSSIVRLVGKKNTTDRLVIGTIAGSGKGKKQVSYHRILALRYESGRQQVGSTSKGDIHLIIVHHWRLSCIWNWLHESVIIITVAMWFQVRVVNGLGDIGCHLMVGARPIMIMPPIDVVGCIRLGAIGVRNNG